MIDKELLMNQIQPYNNEYDKNNLSNIIEGEIIKYDVDETYDILNNYIVVLYNTCIYTFYVCKCNLYKIEEHKFCGPLLGKIDMGVIHYDNPYKSKDNFPVINKIRL